MSEWPAAVIARYDQELKAVDEEIDCLVTALQAGAAQYGERQAVANVGALLMRRDPGDAAVLLTAALRRLAGTGA